MVDFYKDNENKTSSSSDSTRFQGKVKPDDVIKEQELRAKEIQEEYHKIYKDFEESCGKIDECINEESDTPEQLFDQIFGFFEDAFDKANVKDEKEYQKIKDAIFSQTRKRDRLLSMLEFIKSLLKKLFSAGAGSSLNWQERLKKEIEDLEKELLDENLSPEELISKLERLNLLKFVNLFGPLNFMSMIIKALTIFVALEATSLVGEGFIKELLVREKVVLPENRRIQEEITGNFIMNIVNMLRGVAPLVQDIGALLSIAIIESVTAGVKAEVGIVDTRIPYLLLPVIHEPALPKLPAAEKEVQAKPKEKPKQAPPLAPAKPKPEFIQEVEKKSLPKKKDKGSMRAERRVGTEPRANESSVGGPSSAMQETQLEQHRSERNQERS
ncbi:Hypothetical protein CINCED_3A000492 [Cinara cedri]|uniref:Uncharacterized protein n=1 Tax=Cinara cedri TaxID=506608 RepID=A0A5E4NGS8_9HEMI|nr:Hypothetical protein CINCED_3A000492 [Cinara cedri]